MRVALGRLPYGGQMNALIFLPPFPNVLLLPASYHRFGECSSLPVILGRGNQRSLLFCASVEMQSLPSAVCLSASRSARFLHVKIRFSLSVPLTHFKLFEGTVELPGGCSSVFGEHGWVVELSGQNSSSTPKTHGRRMVLEVQAPFICSPVFGRMFFCLCCVLFFLKKPKPNSPFFFF